MMQQYKANSYLFGGNAPYVEELYESYLDNPGSVPDKWRAYFDALQNAPATDGSDTRDVARRDGGDRRWIGRAERDRVCSTVNVGNRHELPQFDVIVMLSQCQVRRCASGGTPASLKCFPGL